MMSHGLSHLSLETPTGTVQALAGGPASAPVLWFLHGTGAAATSWEPVMRRLSPQFRVIAVDLPGHGGTAYPGFEALTLPRLTRWLDSLAGLLPGPPLLIVGHSAGAAIALSSARHPTGVAATVPRIVGLCPALRPPLLQQTALWPFVRELATAGLTRAAVREAGRSPTIIRALLASTGSQLDGTRVGDYLSRFASPQHTEAAYAMSANWDLRPLWEALPHIDTPTVLAAGRRDTWIPASDVRLAARRLPHGSYRDWAELGHLAHEEAPAVVADFIVDVAAAAGSA